MRFAAVAALFTLCVSAQDHAQLAADLAQRGDLKGAERELRSAISAAPNSAELLTSLGAVLGMEGDLAQANVYLAKAVTLNPRDAAARRNLGANEWQLGHFDKARRSLEPLLRANPHDAGAAFLLGMVAENQKDYARSAVLLASVPQVLEQQPAGWVALAHAYYATKHRAEARAALGKLPVDRAGLPVAMAGVRVAMDAADFETALKVATAAAQSFPDSYEAFSTQAALEMKLQAYSDAVRSSREAMRLHPTADTMRQAATAEWRAGMREQARADFDKTIVQFPRDAAAREVYGTLLLEDGSPGARKHAITLLREGVALDKTAVEARYQLANAEMEDGAVEQALAHLEEAVRIDARDSRLHYALSRAYRRLGRTAEANAEMQTYTRLKTPR